MLIWKLVFALAAAFNLLVGVPLLIAPEAFLKAAGGGGSPDLLSAQLSGLLIAVFGVGYAMVARDPTPNRPIVWLGLLGKAPLPLLVWLQISAGKAPANAIALPLVDLVFAALFLTFLLRTPRLTAR